MEECPVCGAYNREVAAVFQEGMRAQAMGPTMADHERIDQLYIDEIARLRAVGVLQDLKLAEASMMIGDLRAALERIVHMEQRGLNRAKAVARAALAP